MKWTIRKGKLEDKKAVEAAHRQSIRNLCTKEYNQEQIRLWSAVDYKDEHWKKSILEDYYLVIELDGTVEGFMHASIQSEDKSVGEVFGLYFSPKLAGLGAGRVAVEQAFTFFRAQGCQRAYVAATKTAKGFYEKMGFTVQGPEEIWEGRGAQIEYFPMGREL